MPRPYHLASAFVAPGVFRISGLGVRGGSGLRENLQDTQQTSRNPAKVNKLERIFKAIDETGDGPWVCEERLRDIEGLMALLFRSV